TAPTILMGAACPTHRAEESSPSPRDRSPQVHAPSSVVAVARVGFRGGLPSCSIFLASTLFDGRGHRGGTWPPFGRSKKRGIERELVALSPGGRHPPVV